MLANFAREHHIGEKIGKIGHKIERFGERIHDFVDEHHIGDRIKSFLKKHDDPGQDDPGHDALPDGATSQFAAGFLYGASGQQIDQRDYIVECSEESDTTKNELWSAFDAYIAKTSDKYKEGNQNMMKAKTQWRDDMAKCEKTNTYFHNLDKEMNDFFAQKNWNDIVKGNYKANKDYVD